jgi:hypothetical protein
MRGEFPPEAADWLAHCIAQGASSTGGCLPNPLVHHKPYRQNRSPPIDGLYEWLDISSILKLHKKRQCYGPDL